MTTAAERWREELSGWAIPDDILAAAPEPPWGFPVELFRAEATAIDTPSRTRAREVLPDHGAVLDIGCGGGTASFALVPPAALVVGVDSSESMLAEYAATAGGRGIAHQEVLGAWPEIASMAPVVDVVACHHVLYNVPDPVPFVDALSAHARRRVVLELTARHPMVAYAPLWQHFHGIDRPEGPTADLAAELLQDAGVPVQVERSSRTPHEVPREALVRLYRRRLCLPVSAEPEIDRILPDAVLADRPVVTLWWDC